MAKFSSPPTKVIMKHVHCIQLEKDNYYSWEVQFSTMLRGFELFGYIDGSVELNTPLAGQQDQHMLSWILTGISPMILPQVVAFRTSAGVCTCLQKLYMLSTQTRQLHLRFQLQTICKGGLSMEDFITKISILKDALSSTGESLKESEIILIALGALGEEYESFVTSITARFDPAMTFSGLCKLQWTRKFESKENH